MSCKELVLHRGDEECFGKTNELDAIGSPGRSWNQASFPNVDADEDGAQLDGERKRHRMLPAVDDPGSLARARWIIWHVRLKHGISP